jgi:hypothetical protein
MGTRESNETSTLVTDAIEILYSVPRPSLLRRLDEQRNAEPAIRLPVADPLPDRAAKAARMVAMSILYDGIQKQNQS